VRRAFIAVVTTHAAMAVDVWNRRLRVCADVHRYANIVICGCIAFQIFCFIHFYLLLLQVSCRFFVPFLLVVTLTAIMISIGGISVSFLSHVEYSIMSIIIF